MYNDPDSDPNDGNNTYLVRLLFRISATSPEDAVEQYIEQILSHGLRNWSYRVEDEETGDMWHLDGYGDEVQARAAAVTEVEEDDDDDDEALDDPPPTAANPALQELLRLSKIENYNGLQA